MRWRIDRRADRAVDHRTETLLGDRSEFVEQVVGYGGGRTASGRDASSRSPFVLFVALLRRYFAVDGQHVLVQVSEDAGSSRALSRIPCSSARSDKT